MMDKKIHYSTIPEFDKDFKKLEKRFRTLKKGFGGNEVKSFSC